MNDHLSGTELHLPTDLIELVDHWRRHDGTLTPGAFEVAEAIVKVLASEGHSVREQRLIAARFVIALEGDRFEYADARDDVIEMLGTIDLKKYW